MLRYPYRLCRPICFAVPFLAAPWIAADASADPTLAAAQPSIPQPASSTAAVDDSGEPALLVRQRGAHKHVAYRRTHRHHFARYPTGTIDRPALAGVELLLPLPPPGQPPHLTVPLPAYPLDSVAAALTTPPPPVVCHRTRPRPDLPDPRLYREVTVTCEPDNP